MKYLFCSLIVFCLSGAANAQTVQRCGTMENLELLKQQDPGLESRMAVAEQLSKLQSPLTSSTPPVVLRVVVHVVWNTPVQNISEAQILSQIDVLNEDYGRYNVDANNTPSVFAPVAANTGIQFCLANVDPQGNPTNGINRVFTNATSFGINNDIKFASQGGVDAWDPNTYINIWVGNLSGGLLGYAQFPGGSISTSGVVILYNAFGRVGTLVPTYNLGRTLTHEMGHFLNLRHIWGDANCGDDFISDTPTQQTSNFSCPTFPHITCGNAPNGDMFMNYMDYTDDACMNLFTMEQKNRMHAAINQYYPGLLSNLNCYPNHVWLSGKVFFDQNMNGVLDTNETGMANHKLMLLPDSLLLVSNLFGDYATIVDSGAYTIELVPDTLWSVSNGVTSYNLAVDSTDICCNDFGLNAAVVYEDVTLSYTAGQYRCGFIVPAWMTIQNIGTTVVSGSVWTVPDPAMNLISSYPAYNYISGDTIFFLYNNLNPGQSLTFSLNFGMPLTPNLALCSNSMVTILNGPNYFSVDEGNYCDTITCSFDPNDKQVIPPGVQAQHYILKTDSLLYTIRFQNEGNDTAFTVVLRDQLSEFIDPGSIELISSSHPVTLTVDTSQLAEFRFENILLPYKSIDEPGSNGFVKFRVVPYQGLSDGTVIENEAGIYFDFNPPVITNNTFVTLVTTIPVGVDELSQLYSLQVHPLPFSDFFELELYSEYEAEGLYKVVDITGREIMDGSIPQGKKKRLTIDSSQWNKGVYLLYCNDKNGEVRGRIKLVRL